MLGDYNTSPKIIANETKEEMSNISKGSGDMTPSNGSFADNENERIKEELEKIFKEMKEPNREIEEKLMKEYKIYCQSSLMRK